MASEDFILEELPECPGADCHGCESWDCEYYGQLAPVFSEDSDAR